jgi:Asp-tRNA(Asn)/Glu-tRNA(Gln) amidotransferase B subunit
MYKWLLIPPDPLKIEDVHYQNEKLEEIMSGYKENQAEATRMFNERKRDMMEAKSFLKPGDENSKFYTKPDEAPISHPADVIERLKKEKPDAPMEELVKEADAIVATEVEERRKKREAEAEAEASTEAKIEESKEEGEPEVSSA